MINIGDRVYISSCSDYATVRQIIPTGVVGLMQYRVQFHGGAERIFGEAFIQPAPVERRAMLRLVCSEGVRV